MDKEYALEKDGLPLTRNCSYFKIGENDESKLIDLCTKNNIKFEKGYSSDFKTECDVEECLIAKAEDEYGLDNRLALDRAMKNLKKRELNILKDRFIVGKTQMEIAEELGISQAQISRIEKNAINTIKKNIK